MYKLLALLLISSLVGCHNDTPEPVQKRTVPFRVMNVDSSINIYHIDSAYLPGDKITAGTTVVTVLQRVK